MKTVVIRVTADPRHSGRAAEGMRVADGLSHGEGLALSVLVEGAAAEAFAEKERGAWIDESLLLRHHTALRLNGVPARWTGPADALLAATTEAEAAALRAGADAVIEF
jgi:hypothetical protein